MTGIATVGGMTRYERFRDRMLAEIRFNVARMIAEHAGETEIEMAVNDVVYCLRTQNFLHGLRTWMKNPNENSLASAVAWTAEVQPHGQDSSAR
jgi:hypothetical protein